MIQAAKTSSLDQILDLTQACAKRLIDQEIFQWNESYPNSKVFQNDIERGELYVYMIGNTVIGCIVISTIMDKEYETVQWLTQNSNQYYIHRLAVHPDHQGKGIARTLMDFAENLAVQNNIASVRLDTFSENFRNQKFYEARGYHQLESIYFHNQSEFPFYCYELPLSETTS